MLSSRELGRSWPCSQKSVYCLDLCLAMNHLSGPQSWSCGLRLSLCPSKYMAGDGDCRLTVAPSCTAGSTRRPGPHSWCFNPQGTAFHNRCEEWLTGLKWRRENGKECPGPNVIQIVLTGCKNRRIQMHKKNRGWSNLTHSFLIWSRLIWRG